MSEVKKTKKYGLLTVLTVFSFVLVRAFLLTDRTYIGVDDFYKLEFSYAPREITLIVLFLAFAVLGALVISKLGKKFGEDVAYVSALLLAEPFLFAKQADCISLFVIVLGLLFVLNGLCEKKILPDEVGLIVFLFVSTLLVKNAIFLFVVPALLIYFFKDITTIFKKMLNIIVLILSVISVGAGVLLNNFFTEKYPAFEAFIKEFSFFQQINYKDVEYENIGLLLFAVPTLIFGVMLIVNLFKDGQKVYAISTTVAVAIAYIVSLTGFFFIEGSRASYTINYIMPVVFIATLNNTENKASAIKVNKIISEHKLIFAAVIVLVFCIAVRCFFENVDNLARFMNVI